MATKGTAASRNAAKDPEVAIETALMETEGFFERNWKVLLGAVVVIVVAIGCYFAYQGLYLSPRIEKASAMMYAAEQRFAAGEFEQALNGDGNRAGFLEVIEQYGSTPQGNIASHYAGICYMKAQDWENALTYLAKYRPTKGTPNALINAQNYGLQGDVYVQLKDYANAVSLYKKAVDAADNVFTTPAYLKKLGLVYEAQGNYTEAMAAYQKIADFYPQSLEAQDIEKYIGQAEQK